jgi:excisionase family DNA binding protein
MIPNSDKHLFQLSVREFIDLVEKLKENVPDKKIIRDIISAKEAAEITGLKVNSIYSKVSRQEIPVVSRGKPLRFSRAAIEKWLNDGRPTLIQMKGKG